MSQLPPGFVLDGGAAGPVYGPPPKAPAPPTPFQVEDQAFQRNAEQRAAEDQRFQREKFAWEQRKQEEDRKAGVGVDGKATEYQSKSAGFLGRLLQAEREFSAVPEGSRDARTIPGQWLHQTFPGVENTFNSGDRQKADQAARNFIAASLRQESGAAIGKEEYENQYRIFFPMPGDGPDVIAQKAEARRQAIEGFKIAAGPLIGKVADVGTTDAEKKLIATAPDGTKIEFMVPEGADESQIKAAAAKAVQDKGINPGTVKLDEAATAPADSGSIFSGDYSFSNIGQALKTGLGDVVQGVGDIAGIIGNPLNATINAVTGSNLSTDIGETARSDVLGIPHGNNPAVEMINRGGASALTGGLAARGLASLVSPGAVQGALNTLGATPGRDMLAGAGAGGGGEIGKQVGGVPGQVAGTIAGGLAGYRSAGSLADMMTPRSPTPLLQKADSLGVTMLPADVGGVGTRMATGGIGRTLGGIPLAEGATKSIASASAARSRIANDIGATSDNVGAGQATKRGFEAFTKGSAERAGQLYEQVSVPAESTVQLDQTRGALAEVTQGMKSNPALSKLWANHPRLKATLEALTPEDPAAGAQEAFRQGAERLTKANAAVEEARRFMVTPDRELSAMGRARIGAAEAEQRAAQKQIDDALAQAQKPPEGGELSWQDMKRFRSIVGEIVGQPGVQRDGSDIAALRKLYGALTTDMEATAAATSPRALQEFRRATQYWRGRESRIDEVFSVLLGKDGNRSEEGVFRQINTWAKGENGDFGRLARTIRSMPGDEANVVRSTLIQRMGMAKPANQDATQEVFSPALFSTEWRGLSPRAKNVLFPNKQHRDDLESLAEITDRMKKAGEFQNFSNTALGVNVSGQGALALTNLPVAAALAGLQFGAGKLLASPRFARLLASSNKLPPKVANRRIVEQLGVLGTREPLLKADALALQEHLKQALGQSPVRAAASDEEQN